MNSQDYTHKVKEHFKRPQNVRDNLYMQSIIKNIEELIDEMISNGSAYIRIRNPPGVNPTVVKMALCQMGFETDNIRVFWGRRGNDDEVMIGFS